MENELQPSVKKVSDYLISRGHHAEIKQLSDSTRTAQEAADTLGCDVSQIAKSIVFKDEKTEEPVLVIASGSNRIDVEKLNKSYDMFLVQPKGKYVKKKVGYSIGGIPPVAHHEKVKTFLDQDLKNHQYLWAAAGTPYSVFRITTDELNELTEGEWIEVK